MDIILLLTLFFVHFLADFPLQGDYLAKYKDPHRMGKSRNDPPWWYCMLAHSAIHGGFVSLIISTIAPAMWWLGLCEVVAHFWIDTGKCYGYFGYMTDQYLHLVCKVIWMLLVAASFGGVMLN